MTIVIERMEWYRFKPSDVKNCWTTAEGRKEQEVPPHCLQTECGHADALSSGL